MTTNVIPMNRIGKKNKSFKFGERNLELLSINEARRKIGLPELICKERGCIVCNNSFKSLDASHRVCDKCRPKWERKKNQLEKAIINIEDTDSFDIHDLEELNIFENIDVH